MKSESTSSFPITKQLRSAIRRQLAGTYRSIHIGRSYNTAGMGTRTPIKVVPGDQAPELCGYPYLKMFFSTAHGFARTLYTPSTLHVVVGQDWLMAQQQEPKGNS